MTRGGGGERNVRGGTFGKAEATEEEPGEEDAPPSYAAYRGCIIHQKKKAPPKQP